MSALPKKKWTEEEYLAFERASDTKHEFFNGEVFDVYAMAGASRNHVAICFNVSGALYVQLRQKPCQAYTNDMRVKIDMEGHYAYPDIAVVCGEPEFFEDSEVDTLLNPTVIIEVLSPSTESYDRGAKFQSYRALASLREYLLISQDSHRIEHYVREGEQWILSDAKQLDAVLTLPSIDCTLALADVYEKISFEKISFEEQD